MEKGLHPKPRHDDFCPKGPTKLPSREPWVMNLVHLDIGPDQLAEKNSGRCTWRSANPHDDEPALITVGRSPGKCQANHLLTRARARPSSLFGGQPRGSPRSRFPLESHTTHITYAHFLLDPCEEESKVPKKLLWKGSFLMEWNGFLLAIGFGPTALGDDDVGNDSLNPRNQDIFRR
jgi:hypothetical protein